MSTQLVRGWTTLSGKFIGLRGQAKPSWKPTRRLLRVRIRQIKQKLSKGTESA
jgi:50S ribosomal subunit-associated GTPase HflX